MKLLPYHTETLVSALSKQEVLGHLIRVTAEVNYLDQRTRGNKKILFNGMVGQKGFRISKVVDKGDTFLPLVLGQVEETPRGSIIFLKYRLFPGAIFFLAFWSFILAAFTVYFFAVIHQYNYGAICLALGLVNYGLAMYFFQRQVRASRKIFHQLINFQLKD
ncbi:hypothetical protein [Algoriphagus halophilus]|uniref:Uncharacterized protein n=1 Tax=Algoriphagus halophilus TaxID=226505 RepID=A0A1N6FWI9_9BACT|nr:hypothetical protein [Algoriphagus halophilus]SIN99665.1 hypothetical protein SAMN05444394_2787 [Algoriphagus halophilus]